MEDTGWLSYADLPSVDIFIMQYIFKMTFSDIVIIFSWKFLLIGKLSKSWWYIHVFPNSDFYLKAQMLSLATNIFSFFLQVIADFVHL